MVKMHLRCFYSFVLLVFIQNLELISSDTTNTLQRLRGYNFTNNLLSPINRRLQSNPNSVICFSTEYEGRMGNLMFEYAAVVGLCVKNGRDVQSCAQIVFPRYNDPDTPVHELVDTFRLPQSKIPGCVLDKNYDEHKESKSAVMFDAQLMNVSSGTTIHGYLQSYKYFHPHAQKEIREVFTFSEHVQTQSAAFIRSIRNKLRNTTSSSGRNSTNNTDYKLVAVHVRLGDKMNSPTYNTWSLSMHYYAKAIALVRAQHGEERTAFVFFTGGSKDKRDNEKDKDWTRTHLAHNISRSFHEESGNHLVALHAISLCDVIIAAHSSYSWWAAYLSTTAVDVVAPRQYYPHPLPEFVPEDYYLPGWQLVSEDPAEDRIRGVSPFAVPHKGENGAKYQR